MFGPLLTRKIAVTPVSRLLSFAVIKQLEISFYQCHESFVNVISNVYNYAEYTLATRDCWRCCEQIHTHTGTCKPIHSDERLWNVRTKYRLVRPMEKKEQQTHGRRVEIFNRTRSSFSIFALANAFLIRFRRGNWRTIFNCSHQLEFNLKIQTNSIRIMTSRN